VSDNKPVKTDVHQHIWTAPLVHALAQREELPFVRYEQGLTVLFLAGERPYVIDREAEAFERRAALVELDGLDRALLCPSSPLGVEALPRPQALGLIEAYLDGALALGEPFGVWGAIALDAPRAEDVDDVLGRGCVGITLPAGVLAGVDGWGRLASALGSLESSAAPLFVHPGPGPGPGARGTAGEISLSDPLWWPALTRYVAEMQAAWLSFRSVGRRSHPRLRVVFSMLAGLAPLHAERLASRGGPTPQPPDPLVFYDTSSYGPRAVGSMEEVVGRRQLLYGSDRPLVDPDQWSVAREFDHDILADNVGRALSEPSFSGAVSR
jgi:hypothetical protein